MTDNDLLTRYNYDEFVPEKFQPWLNFSSSPTLGRSTSDFPLWDVDENQTSLRAFLSEHDYAIVEFGSFT